MRIPLGRVGLLLVLSVGLAATMFWLNEARGLAPGRFGPPTLAAGLVFVVSVAVLNLAVRWCRWHFLLRRARFRIPTRDSLLTWVVALPALLTPFAVGELLRSLLLRRRYPGIGPAIALVWLVERSCDVVVLASFYALASGRWIAGGVAPAAWLVLAAAARSLSAGAAAAALRPRALVVVLGSTVVAWLLPVIGFWALLARLGPPVPLDLAFLVFSTSTLAGSLTGLPLGIGVTGSLVVIELRAAGVDLAVAIAGTALLRAGTAWFAVGLGLACLLVWRSRVRGIVKPAPGADHFDAIAERYGDEIPAHVSARLLDRKVELIETRLAREGVAAGARGLDVGCGQGWYACELARRGYEVVGIDRSAMQVAQARRHARERGVEVEFEEASVTDLPYPDSRFDFAYAINVLHHLADEESIGRALSEIVRVLRPGGIFFLHEMNTRNPLFQFYMGYVFPVLRRIDVGDERWVRPDRLPDVRGAHWSPEVEYFTFLPEFLSAWLTRRLRSLEAALERSSVRHGSAHYVARLRKHA